jgi:hypothetical protein
MRVSLLSVLLLGGCLAPARGQTVPWNRVVLVELFTSQGCSSCPAADALVRELPGLGFGRDRVLPLTFHVSYWDGYGWKDPFSAQAFTDRQQWYADAGRLRSPDLHVSARELYTPQMVVDGAVHFSGARRQVALSELRKAATRAPAVSLSGAAFIEGDVASVTVRASAPGPSDPRWRLFVALAVKSAHTPVPSGENSGRTLEEADVVRALSPPLPLPRDGAASVRLDKPAGVPWSNVELVAFVQSTVSLEVAGATSIGLRGQR